MSNIQNCPLKPKRLPSLITFVKQHIAASSVQQRVGNRALGNGCVFGNRRVLVDLGLVVLEGSVGDRAHLAGFLLCQVRVGRREIRANRANDGAGCVGDGALVVGVLEGRAGAGVLDVGGGYIGVVVDDGVAVVLHLGVGDRATSFGVAGVVVRVVGREGGGGRSHNGANLLGVLIFGGCWVRKMKRVTERERRDKQTKGTAATPANPALLPLVASLVFNLEWFQTQRSTRRPR
jgi:hypothetical protein